MAMRGRGLAASKCDNTLSPIKPAGPLLNFPCLSPLLSIKSPGGVQKGVSTSSSFTVTRKELVQQCLQDLVGSHGVALAQVVAAGRAGEHFGPERAL